MKNLLRLISLFVMLICYNAISKGQPQWKFHLAFEDATGAKDTIWMIWDTTANANFPESPIDYHLGEGSVEMDQDKFNVYFINWESDSTKTMAVPYSRLSMANFIYAFNYELPLKLTWDTTLFNASYLPSPTFKVTEATLGNDYIFFFNSDSELHGLFNMLTNDRIKLPEHDVDHFPLGIIIKRNLLSEITEITYPKIIIFPNPVNEHLKIKSNIQIKNIRIFDLNGKIIKEYTSFLNKEIIELNTFFLDAGIYYIQLVTPKTIYHEKFIKIN